MEALGSVLGGIAGEAGEAYAAKEEAAATIKTERERQKGLLNVVKTALPWVIGGLVVVVFIIFVIARSRKKAA